MLRQASVLRVLGVVLVLALAFFAVRDAHGSGEGAEARASMTIIAPASAGGGWDLVARESQKAMRSDGIVGNVTVVNIPGAGGTIGLSSAVALDGEAATLLVTGTVMLGGIVQGGGSTTLADTVPIARLAEDFEVIAVPANSPYRTFEDFVADWQANPSMAIGGGSAGGIDHLVAAQLAQAVGLDPADLQYTPHSGGGDLTLSLTSVADGTVNVGISGYNDFRDLIEDGRLRALAVVAPEPLQGVDVPTMIDLGYPEVDLVNWRGLVAPPGISDEQRAELEAIVAEMIETDSWAEAIALNRWVPNPLYGQDFAEFIDEEQQRIRELMEELGLA